MIVPCEKTEKWTQNWHYFKKKKEYSCQKWWQNDRV